MEDIEIAISHMNIISHELGQKIDTGYRLYHHTLRVHMHTLQELRDVGCYTGLEAWVPLLSCKFSAKVPKLRILYSYQLTTSVSMAKPLFLLHVDFDTSVRDSTCITRAL